MTKVEKLKHLIKILKKVPDDNFLAIRWIDTHVEEVGINKAIKAGGVYCAGGWAAKSKKFIALGLCITIDENTRVTYNGQGNSYLAVKGFFEMDDSEAEYIFLDNMSEDVTTKDIIKRIKQIM